MAIFERKKQPSHVDPFLLDSHPDQYISDFAGLPKTDSLEHANDTVGELRTLMRKYHDDQGGMRHVRLITEIGERKALTEGKPAISKVFSEFLAEVEKQVEEDFLLESKKKRKK